MLEPDLDERMTDYVSRVPAGCYRAEGMIKNVNTVEEYRGIDKGNMLQQAGRTVSTGHRSNRVASPDNMLRYGTLSTTAPSILVLLC